MSCQCKTDKQREKCVWWVGPEAGFLQVNDVTKETRLATGCFPHLVLDILRFVVKSNTSAAAAVESTRNVMFDGLVQLGQVLAVPHFIEARRLNGPETTD